MEIFVTFLLLERSKEHSNWKHYIDNLPKTYSIPTYWDEQTRKCLTQYTQIELLKQKIIFEESFKTVSALLYALDVQGLG